MAVTYTEIEQQKNRRIRITVCAVVSLLGFAIYSQTLSSTFHFDDLAVIVDNPAIRDLSNLQAIWDAFNTRVVAGFTFALNYALGGLNFFGYHLFNVIVHIFSSLLVYALVILTFRTPLMKDSPLTRHLRILALSASLIFLVHPIQTQAINYVWQRVASLSTFFYLVSLILYIQARLKNRLSHYLWAWLATCLSMFTKETAVTLPFMILLYEFSFFGSWRKRTRTRLLPILPFFLTLLFIPLTLTRSDHITLKLMKSPSLTASAAQGKTFPELLSHMTRWYFKARLSRKDYLLTQLSVVRTYLRLLFFPIRQNLDYDYPISHRFTEPKTLFSFFLLLSLFLMSLKLFNKHRLIAFSIFWFFITLSVESLVTLPNVIFEHRLYLPMVGFSIFLPTALSLLLQETRRIVAVSSAIVLVFSIATYNRNKIWKDEITLWEDVVKKSPKKAGCYYNLGFAYNQKKEYDKAASSYQKAIELDPSYIDALNNLGVLYYKKGDYDQAIACSLKTVQLNPNYALGYANLGLTYYRKGDYGKMIEYCFKAIQLDPAFVGSCGTKMIAYYQRAIQLNPTQAEAYDGLGIAYGSKGDYDKAIAYDLKALQLNPSYGNAYANLGATYAQKGEYQKAVKTYWKLTHLDPANAQAHRNLGAAYAKKGDRSGLLREIRKLRSLHREDLAGPLEQLNQ